MQGLKAVTRTVQIPLKGRAVQINLVCPADKAGNIDKTLAMFLDRLDGDSDWTLMRDRDRRICIIFAASCLVAVALLQYFFWRSFRRRQARERKTGIRPKLTKDAQSRRGILIAVFIFCSVFFSLMALGGFVFGLGPDVQVDLDSRLDKGLNGSAIFSGWVALCGMGITVWRMKQAAKRQAAADRQTAAAMLSPPPETPDFENITE
jgi:hypothetical protein